MARLKAIKERIGSLYGATKRELLRDPNVVLFTRGPEEADRSHDHTIGAR